MKNKKVIFIGGTAYSGSTFFDMILSNDPNGFSCGEVYALFHPFRPHHINPICSCMDKNCHLWNSLLKKGKQNLYKTIFEMFPNIDYIVDSSKELQWIKEQNEILEKQKINVKNILIWKTPEDFLKSILKRNGKKDRLKKSWIIYHRKFATWIKEWRSVSYKEFTTNDKKLKEVCEYLEIPFYTEKKEFWNKKHHTVFGNNSAKVHLSEKVTPETNEKEVKRKEIYYFETKNKNIKRIVEEYRNKDKYFDTVEKMLVTNDVSKKRNETTIKKSKLNYLKSKIYLIWATIKRIVGTVQIKTLKKNILKL